MNQPDAEQLTALLAQAHAKGDPLAATLLATAAALIERAGPVLADPLLDALDALRMSVGQWLWACELRAADEDAPQAPDPTRQALADWLASAPRGAPAAQLMMGLSLVEGLDEDAAPRALAASLLDALGSAPSPAATAGAALRDRAAAHDALRAALRLLDREDEL